jgi:hypothetical protein
MNTQLLRLFAAASLAAALAAPATAATVSFVALLSGAGEVPPVITTASGQASVTFNDLAFSVSVHESFTGLVGGVATASHIHCCTPTPGTGSAPVVVPFVSFPTTLSGVYDNTFVLSAASFNALLAGSEAGEAYVNIHDAAFPGGEIQGFLQVVAVPEPETYGLMLGGLAVLGWATRKRRPARAG